MSAIPQSQAHTYFLFDTDTALDDGLNTGDKLRCEKVDSSEVDEFTVGNIYTVGQDSDGDMSIKNDLGYYRLYPNSEFSFYAKAEETLEFNEETHDSWGIGREYKAPKKEWVPDVPDPSVDLMKSIRDACLR